MDVVTLREYETLSPFEIKDFLAKAASEDGERLGGRLPERRPRQSELDRHRAARGVLPARPVRDHREQARAGPAAGRRRHAARRRASPTACQAWLTTHADTAGRRVPRRAGAMGRAEVRLRRRRVRPRTGRLDHRRQLPGARPHARPQRADRPRVPAVGDVRRRRARRAVRPLRGRGRHGGDVLHLQVAEDQPAAQCGRHHRAGHADLHALSRDAAPRGLRPEDRQRPGARRRTASSSPTRS